MNRPSKFFIVICIFFAVVGLVWGVIAGYGIFETIGLMVACSCIGGVITFIKQEILKK